MITDQHIITLGCTHGDEMPARIKGQLFPTVSAVRPASKEDRPTLYAGPAGYPRTKGFTTVSLSRQVVCVRVWTAHGPQMCTVSITIEQLKL